MFFVFIFLFLLILSGDIEINPGPTSDIQKCPCEKSYNQMTIKCSSCSQYWHTTCVGLDKITKVACEKLTRWKCVLCAVIPSSIKEKLAGSLNCSTNETNTVVVQLQKMENLLAKIEETKKINKKIPLFLKQQ